MSDPHLLHPGPDHASVERALRGWLAARDPAARVAVEADLWSRFGRTLTVVVFDMCGFSRGAREEGLIGTLATIGKLRVVIAQVAARHGALAIKFEADNAFLAFETTAPAVAAARAAVTALRASVSGPIEISVGVDRGPVLMLDGADLYGEPVNLASRLGEDLARRGEVLLTLAAAADLGPDPALTSTTLTVAGKPLPAFAMRPA